MSTNSDAEILALYDRVHGETEGHRMEAHAVALRAVAAAAWNEGWNSGWAGRMLHDLGIDGRDQVPNPYALVVRPQDQD